MTDELSNAIKLVRDILQLEAHKHCVRVEIGITAQGYDIDYQLRTPGGLKRDGISMQNLRGEFIK